MTRNGKRAGVVWLLAVSACVSSPQPVKPDNMSAAQHRQEAQREMQAAAQLEERAAIVDLEPSVPPMRVLSPFYLPDPADPLTEQADHLRAHARQHEQAANALVKFEKAECRNIPASSRAACPLFGPLINLEDLPTGVRATFAPGTPVDVVMAHMRCHLAYAQSRGFEEVLSCPLYIRGIDIVRSSVPEAIEIVSADPAVAAAIRDRSREEASFLRHRAP
jgi:hypothetical protein